MTMNRIMIWMLRGAITLKFRVFSFYFGIKPSVSPRPHDFLSLRMKLVHMFHKIWIFGERATAVLADKHFRASFPETELVYHAVNAREVRF